MSTPRNTIAPLLVLLGLFLAACGGDSPTGPGGSGDRTAVSVVGSVDLPDAANGIHVAGNHAFVAATGEGLVVVDVGDPASPGVVGGLNSIYASGGLEFVSFAGNDGLYVCAGIAGFHVVDVTDPLSPSFMSTVNTPATASDIALTPEASPVLCVADGASGVQFYFGSSGQSTVDTPGMASSVATTSDYCFVTDMPTGPTSEAALHVIEIRNPWSPTIAHSVTLSGSPAGIAIQDGFAYIASGDPGMVIVDIRDPESASVVGQTGPLPATGPIAIDPTRSLVYLGTTDTMGFSNEGLKVIDVQDPSEPRVVTTVDLPDWTTGLASVGDHVYVITDDVGGSGGSTLQIVEVGRL